MVYVKCCVCGVINTHSRTSQLAGSDSQDVGAEDIVIPLTLATRSMPTDTVPEERAIRGGELPALTTNSQVYLAQSPLNLPGRLVEEESVEYKQKEEIQEEGDIVTINCGGFVHMVDAALFRPYPGTLLHNMFSLGEGDRGHVKKR